MAVGAQLRLVVLGGDAKHVVAGDADPEDNLLRCGCRFGFSFLFLGHNFIAEDYPSLTSVLCVVWLGPKAPR